MFDKRPSALTLKLTFVHVSAPVTVKAAVDYSKNNNNHINTHVFSPKLLLYEQDR